MERVIDALTVVVGLCAVVVTGVIVSSRGGRAVVVEPTVQVEDWEEYARGHRLGPEHATVTIIEFGDYECPFCRQSEEHLQAVLRRYPNDVAVVYRHYPLSGHALAHPAAKAAECAADQDMFWEYHRSLYAEAEWRATGMDGFLRLATTVGVPNEAEFEQCVRSNAKDSQIAADRLAAAEIGVNATPTFLVNGRRLMGAIDSMRFGEIIEEIRDR